MQAAHASSSLEGGGHVQVCIVYLLRCVFKLQGYPVCVCVRLIALVGMTTSLPRFRHAHLV